MIDWERVRAAGVEMAPEVMKALDDLGVVVRVVDKGADLGEVIREWVKPAEKRWHYLALLVDLEFKRLERFRSSQERDGYAAGFRAGGDCFVAGGASAVRVPEDLDTLRKRRLNIEILEALARDQ